ncbi:MAG: isoprenyl transferase [Clostridiaceae bacterium]|jgi:undecaprenyl diphosphate synthase|nr:isoprenyl transferase [Bacillota bacterium]NLN51224.1 isoprenyl transferase [Clostridiaceae bacterium]
MKNQGLIIPEHLAIIMDGNGRWAKKRLLPRKVGHRYGAEKLRQVVRWSADYGIKYLSVYAFSAENWARSADEVNALMNLIVEFFGKYEDELREEGVRLRFTGELSDLPEKSLQVVKQAELDSKDRDRIMLNIALSYGGRQEIVRASRLFGQDLLENQIAIDELTLENFRNYLFTPDIPDPDLLIRPGGEVRISNFLLWQLSYTELYFSDVLWPDYSEDDLYQALVEYSKRERRYGKVNK